MFSQSVQYAQQISWFLKIAGKFEQVWKKLQYFEPWSKLKIYKQQIDMRTQSPSMSFKSFKGHHSIKVSCFSIDLAIGKELKRPEKLELSTQAVIGQLPCLL